MTSKLDLMESLTRQILESSDIPDSDDPHQELAQLDSIIDLVDHLHKQLVLKRIPLKFMINQLDSPIIHLPSELLSQIFTFSIISYGDSGDKQKAVTPLFLGSICRMWREIAWTSPELWSTMHLCLVDQDISLARQLAQQWLDRSGELPLSLGISCDAKASRVSKTEGDPIVIDAHEIKKIISIFLQHSNRWRDLDLRIPTSFFRDFRFPPHTTSPLRYLFIDPPDGQSLNGHTLIMQQLPNLQKLNLASVYLKSMKLQWDNITHVSAKAFYTDECLDIMRRCPRLVCLKLPFIIGGEEANPNPGPICLPSLKYLQLNPEKDVSIVRLLDTLTLPSLEELHHDRYGKDMEPQPFLDLFSRSSCALRSFSLSNVAIEFSDLVHLLEKMPTLKKLTFTSQHSDSNLTTELLSKMATGAGDLETPFLPALKMLECKGSEDLNWSDLLQIMTASIIPRTPSTGMPECPLSASTTGAPALHSTPNIRELRAVNIRFPSVSSVNRIPEHCVSQLLELIDRGRYLDIQYASVDLLADDIRRCMPDEFSKYLDLRKKMRSTWKDPFAEEAKWFV